MADRPAVAVVEARTPRLAAAPEHEADGFEPDEPALAIEIAAPDGYSSGLLIEHATPWFHVELVPGSESTIRLRPPAEGIWVFELIALIERWLDTAALGCAKLSYGSRTYLIRAASDTSPSQADARFAPEAA